MEEDASDCEFRRDCEYIEACPGDASICGYAIDRARRTPAKSNFGTEEIFRHRIKNPYDKE